MSFSASRQPRRTPAERWTGLAFVFLRVRERKQSASLIGLVKILVVLVTGNAV